MLTARAWLSTIRSLNLRRYSTRSNNIDVNHAEFIANSTSNSRWKESESEEEESIGEHGKLLPTASHLFKLILPLQLLRFDQPNRAVSRVPLSETSAPPTVLLLHPSQPLSHVTRLILGSVAPATPTISFRRTSPGAGKRGVRWADSTDVGDFIRDTASHSAKFSLHFSYYPPDDARTNDTTTTDSSSDSSDSSSPSSVLLDVEVPTAAARTRFLRARLSAISSHLRTMESLKLQCDREARHGARRMASAGFALLAVYWGAVARLTFWDYGWDVMEPITYLSGLSTVMAGYLWFLYQGREVSYSSVLDRSISARREALYEARGFDFERWMDLTSEARRLRGEVRRIEGEYEERRGGGDMEEEGEGEDEEGRKDDTNPSGS